MLGTRATTVANKPKSQGFLEGFKLGEQHGWISDLERHSGFREEDGFGGVRLEAGRPR